MIIVFYMISIMLTTSCRDADAEFPLKIGAIVSQHDLVGLGEQIEWLNIDAWLCNGRTIVSTSSSIPSECRSLNEYVVVYRSSHNTNIGVHILNDRIDNIEYFDNDYFP